MVGGISNLLAEITGEKPSPSPAPIPRTNPLPKRKAPNELRKEPPKTARTGAEPSSRLPAQSTSTPNKPDRPVKPERPAERPADRPTPALNRPALASRPADKTTTPGRYNGSAGRKPSSVGPGRPAPATAPPAPRPLAPAATQKPPKKGSFAEIMARAQAAQESMGPVGAIQHKKVERKKEKDREEARADPRALKGKPARLGSQGLPSRQGSATASKDRPRGGSLPVSSKTKKSAEPEPEKKVRKPPTTGYAGTARPRPNAPASSRDKKKLPAAGGVLLNPQLSRSRAPKYSRREEEEEDDMSDFIEYDDDDDELGGMGGPRRHYYSDEDESDMEAGLDEIDDEEAEAEYIARQDDLREQQIERKLKLEKERRKREALGRGR